jgi:hypothetical protein
VFAGVQQALQNVVYVPLSSIRRKEGDVNRQSAKQGLDPGLERGFRDCLTKGNASFSYESTVLSLPPVVVDAGRIW